MTLTFLRSKIEEIRIALFKAEMDSVLQLPNNIISTLKVDDEGYIWFYTSCNGTYAPQVQKEFFHTLTTIKRGEIRVYELVEEHALLKVVVRMLLP